MFVNARAVIEGETPTGTETVIQTRYKPHEGGQWIELPGGRVEEFESLAGALRREVREETRLTFAHVAGLETKADIQAKDTNVECLRPFAVYQTTRAAPSIQWASTFAAGEEGELLDAGDDTENPRWFPVHQVARWMGQQPDTFCWIERAGLLSYLRETGRIPR